jgi:TRAP-type mannitol/chloroaromatic compound transport system permease small subunit
MAGETVLKNVTSKESPSITLAGVMNGAGTFLILFLMTVMLIDISGRLVLNRPLVGVPEMVSMAIVAIVFLQLPHAVASRAMIRSGMLIDTLEAARPRLGALVNACCNIVGALVFLAITYASWRFLLRAWLNEETYGTAGVFEFPQWPLRAVIVLGAFWTAVEFGRLLWMNLRTMGARS